MRVLRGVAITFLAMLAATPSIVLATASQASVPPGFDNGNQSPNPLSRLAANVNLSTLKSPGVAFAPTPITATDDVIGQHRVNDPLALLASTGLASPATPTVPSAGAPPDTQIAAGGAFVMEVVNPSGTNPKTGSPLLAGSIAVFDRKGSIVKVTTTSSLFNVSQTSDPKVVFDAQTGRWYFSIMETVHTDAGDAVDLAVSHTSDPTGLWDIYRVFTAASNRFSDQPRLGFSSDKVLIEFSNINRLTWPSFCLTCFNDFMIVIQKSDLISLTAAPRGIAINMSTETNNRQAVVPAIPLPGAEVPTAFAAYRGSDVLGDYESTLVIVGLPSTNDVAFKETGNKIAGVSIPPNASQPGVGANLDAGQDKRMLSVSLVSASSTNFSGVLWSASDTGCKHVDNAPVRDCARINQVITDASGDAHVSIDFNLSTANADIMYPAVVGDQSGARVWVANTVTGPVFPTSQLTLLSFTNPQNRATISYGGGTNAYTTDSHRFGDYSGIYADPTDSTGATVWAATENAAPFAGGSWATSIVEATFNKPVIKASLPHFGFAGDTVDITGSGFSTDTSVRFGGVPSPGVTFLGSDHLQAVAPVQRPTTVIVSATTQKGTNDPVPGPPLPHPFVADRFTYKTLLWSSGSDPLGNVIAIDPSADSRRFSVNTGTGPTAGIAISPDQKTVYATSPTSGTLVSIRARQGTISGSVILGVTPTEIAVSPDGRFALVTDPGAFGGTGGVIPVPLTLQTLGTPLPPIPTPGKPEGVAFAPNGQAYVTVGGTSPAVLILTHKPCPVLLNWCITNALPVLTGTPGPIVAGPDRIWVGVTDAPVGQPGFVYDIDPAAPALASPVLIPEVPSALAASPDGKYAFAITSSAGTGIGFSIVHTPGPDTLGSAFPLTAGPVGGGAVSFDSGKVFVAGGSSGSINATPLPLAPFALLASGPSNSAELATNLPPDNSCGSANWANPTTTPGFNRSPATVGTVVTVNGSILYCPVLTGGSASAVPTLSVTAPSGTGCPASFMIKLPAIPLSAGPVSFSFQFTASCHGTWTVKPALGTYIGPPPGPLSFSSIPIAIH